MKKIFAIYLTFALILSIITLGSQVIANKNYKKIDYSSGSDFNWTILDDFFDNVDGHVSIHGTVFSDSKSSSNSSPEPLSNALVSISLINSDYNFDNIIKIPDIDSVNNTSTDESDKVTISDFDTDDNSNDITIPDLDVDMHNIKVVNFSSDRLKKQSIKKLEKNVLTNPASELNEIKNISINKVLSLWRSTFTYENGKFEFRFLQPGTYNIKASKYGYETSRKTITIEQGSKQVNMYLQRNKIEPEVNKIEIPFNESIKHLREISGKINMSHVYDAIINGSVGCEIVVEKNLESHVNIYYDGLTINATGIDGNRVSLKVSGDEDSTGKTIVINVEGDFFYNPNKLIIEYDQKEIKMADDIEDVLNPDDDGSHAEYLIIHGAEGTTIYVSIPHFSEHEISIYSKIAETVEEIDIFSIIALYALICTLTTIIFVGSISVRKRIR